MTVHLRWRARQWLLPLAVLAIGPAACLWSAAVAQSLGLGTALIGLPTPAAAANRLDRLILLATFWVVTLGGPLIGAGLGLLAVVDAELRIREWDVSARMRLPTQSGHPGLRVALILVGISALLFVGMAGHLAADCLLGSDC